MATQGARSLRIQLVIGFMCVAMVVYFLLLGRIAWAFITSGSGAAIGLGRASWPATSARTGSAWRSW